MAVQMRSMERAWRSLRDRMPVLAAIALLAFLGYKVAHLWGELSQHVWGGNYPLLGLSLLILTHTVRFSPSRGS